MDNLDLISKNYTVESNGDKLNTDAAFFLIKDDIKGQNVLEVGCADGYMSQKISEICKKIVIVEPAIKHCKEVSSLNLKNAEIINDRIENYKLKENYNVIIMASLLHQVPDPNYILDNIAKTSTKGTIIIATIPNCNSLHRRLGVEMGLMNTTSDISERNKFFEQKTYDLNSFKNLFLKSNLNIIESFGYLMKLYPSEISKKLNFTDLQMTGLINLGKKHPELSSQLYIKAII